MKYRKVLIALIAVFLLMLNTPVFAGEIKPQDSIQIDPAVSAAAGATEPAREPVLPVPEPILEPDYKIQIEPPLVDRGPVDPNQSVTCQGPDQMNSIPEIQSYIEANLSDIFASLHIDYDASGREKIVLSFTEEVSPKHKEAILALADDPEAVVFRLVDFTEKQLLAKQAEINAAWNSLLAEGIKVHYTGINVFINRVEVGIEPFTEENVARIHELFGSEMVKVLEGQEIRALAMENGVEPVMAPENDSAQSVPEKPGFFQRIVQFFKSIFSWLIK